MATVVPPVTQDATSSKGPTAMVFMNMGGPSTTDEVGDFLSRLFVSYEESITLQFVHFLKLSLADLCIHYRQTPTSSHLVGSSPIWDLSSPVVVPLRYRSNTLL